METTLDKEEYYSDVINAVEVDDSDKNMTAVVYLLQGLSFFFGITYIVAVIINYVKRNDVDNTFLASHFTWQINTFWASIVMSIVGLLTFYFIIGSFILLANAIWVVYRIIKGALYLKDEKEMY
jgi:uncharacterized membrane protein